MKQRCKKVERDGKVPAKVKPFGKIYRWSNAAVRREMKSVKELFLLKPAFLPWKSPLGANRAIQDKPVDHRLRIYLSVLLSSYPHSPCLSACPAVDLVSKNLSFPSATYYPSPSAGLTMPFYPRRFSSLGQFVNSWRLGVILNQCCLSARKTHVQLVLRRRFPLVDDLAKLFFAENSRVYVCSSKFNV